jgi:ATP-dependent exoDNAse (exonuclease V) alpha subunit
LVAAGQVTANGVELRDGTTAGIGDEIVTRENARRIRTTDGRWVRNGDTWQVTGIHRDGALTVRDAGGGTNRSTRGQVVLDAHYVAEHVQLGYAITAHRAQGATVDTCHVVVSPGMTREAFYVAMTRGRHANTTYVITEHISHELEDHMQLSGEPPSTQRVLRDVLATEGTERSATEHLQKWLIQGKPVRPPRQDPPNPNRSRFMTSVGSAGIGIDR